MVQKQWMLALAVAGLTLTSCNKMGGGSGGELKTLKDKVSYAIGLDIGRNFKQQSLDTKDVDLNRVKQGIEDLLTDKKPLMTDKELQETMMAFQQQMMAKHDSVNLIKSANNLKTNQEFFAKNAKEPGVVTLPDGLQYVIITEGKGKKPDTTNTVTVHYTGSLIDGTVFDSSIQRGQPATFPLKGVIKGWTEVLQLMPLGSKWKVFIPPALAYGTTGAGDKIGPNAALIFEVELLAIN